VADRVRAKMKELKKRFPEGLDYTIAYDTTLFIRESVADVIFTLFAAVGLVAAVVLLFLQDWRAMILPMIDVPVSLIGTFAVMAGMGYSLNNISLFGLVLAIGIVVDDAIVVLENIERQMAKGLDTRTATIKAMEEISGPILAITLVLCAVFVPCAFISGITGRFFRQFAVTIAASTIISAINALTMTPSRALVIFKSKEAHPASGPDVGGARAHSHKPEALPWWIFGALGGVVALWFGPRLLAGFLGMHASPEDELQTANMVWLNRVLYFTPGLVVGLVLGWFIIRPVNAVLGLFFRGFNAAFDRVTAMYGWTIGHALRLSVVVLMLYGGLLVLTYNMFQDAPTGFVPQQDQGRLIVSVQLPDSSSLERTREAMVQVDEITRSVNGVAHTVGLGGISFAEQANGPNFGSLLIMLDPFDQRRNKNLRADAIMAKLRKAYAGKVKDARVVVFGSAPIPGLSTAGGFKVMIEDRGGLGLPTLQDQTDKLIRSVQSSQLGLAGVSTQFRSNTPQLFMAIDRLKVASLGVSLDDVNQTLEMFLGSRYVNSFNEFGRHWQVTVQADRQFRSLEDEIKLFQVRNNKGQMVPLATLVNLSDLTGPIFVRRYNLYTAAPVTGSLLPGVSSGDVIAGVDKLADQNLPRSMKADWTDLMFMQIKEGNTTGIVFALAVVCVFLALAALYESWTLPLAVILVVPLCVLFSLVGVWYTNSSVDIFVQIGLVVLVGLACKNAILVVEFAKQLHMDGLPVFEATVEASRLRLRPILMTSFAFILGVVPLCIATGAGAEMRRSLGSAVFSGMLGVTVFGIFLTPVFFYFIQGVGETPLFGTAVVRWVGSTLFGGFLGAATGYLLGKLGVVPVIESAIVGGVLGVLGVLAVLGIHRTMKGR
jgi:multidrug efflux pump